MSATRTTIDRLPGLAELVLRYDREGLSGRAIHRLLEAAGVELSHVTVARWLRRQREQLLVRLDEETTA